MFVVKKELTKDLEFGFSDFPYRKVFQMNIESIEKLTGLNFTWDGVKKLKVPDDKKQVEKIRKIKDKNDIESASNNIGTKSIIQPDKVISIEAKRNIILP